MSFQRVHQSSSQNSQTSSITSQFAPRPLPVQQPQRPPTQEKIENQAFKQDKFEALGLQLKEQYGTITPVEQERLGVLQAKMDSFWAQRLERAKAQPNLLEVLIRNDQATSATVPLAPVQPKLATGQPSKITPTATPEAPIQPKLTIGRPNDQYEQEADRVAEQVMSMTPCQAGEEELDEIQMKPLANTPSLSSPSEDTEEAPKLETSVVQNKGHEGSCGCTQCIGTVGQLKKQSILNLNTINDAFSNALYRSPIQINRGLEGLWNENQNNNPWDNATNPQQEQEAAQSSLPKDLKTNIETMSNQSLDDVKVHFNSSKPAQLNALAYAQGTDIFVGPGQEKHLPHEAWHVVQQKQGRVQATSQMQDMSVNDDPFLEKEADEMGEKALQRKTDPNANTHHNGCGCTECTAQFKTKVSVSSEPVQLIASSIIQRYAEENDRAVFQGGTTGTSCPFTLQQLFELFTLSRDSIEFQVTNRDGASQTVRFTQAWVYGYQGTAVIRGRVRYEIDQNIGTRAEEIQQLIEDLVGNPERKEELRRYCTQSSERHHRNNDQTVESGSVLVEEASNSGQSFQARGYNYRPFGGPNTQDFRYTVNSWEEALALEPQMRARIRSLGFSDTQIDSFHQQRLASGPRPNEYNSHLIRLHAAWDIGGRTGTAVYAPIAGTVVEAHQIPPTPLGRGRSEEGVFGNFIRIRHERVPTFGHTESEDLEGRSGTEVVYTNYCHLSELLVQRDQQIHPGQAIGLMGNSGLDGGGTHLHFSVVRADRTSTLEEVESSINPRVWWNRVTGNETPYVSQLQPRRRERFRRRTPPEQVDSAGETAQQKTTQIIQQKTQGKEHTIQKQQASGSVIQFTRPANLVSLNFMGVDIPVSRGLHPTMRDRLIAVQSHLQAQYDALPNEERPPSLREYAGLQSIRGWRETTSQHGTGSAVDVNYDDQPYIATRTTRGRTTTYGGEQGSNASAEVRALRQPAVEVYDRAVSFIRTNPYDSDTADVSNRRVEESATDAYRRFRRTSDALRDYLSLAFRTDYASVNRVPIRNPETASEDVLLRRIPTSERKDEAAAIVDIEAFMDDPFWQIIHPNYPSTAREQYFRILREYEIVRRPMQYGAPSANPRQTRNPARGFLNVPEHFVVAMIEIGRLRWGACEFSADSNGDVHHFDLREPYHITQTN